MVAIVAIVSMAIMIFQIGTSFSNNENIVGEAYAIRSLGFGSSAFGKTKHLQDELAFFSAHIDNPIIVGAQSIAVEEFVHGTYLLIIEDNTIVVYGLLDKPNYTSNADYLVVQTILDAKTVDSGIYFTYSTTDGLVLVPTHNKIITW